MKIELFPPGYRSFALNLQLPSPFHAFFIFLAVQLFLAKLLCLVVEIYQTYYMLYPLSCGNVQHIGAKCLNRAAKHIRKEVRNRTNQKRIGD
jgi:hypothetical protein